MQAITADLSRIMKRAHQAARKRRSWGQKAPYRQILSEEMVKSWAREKVQMEARAMRQQRAEWGQAKRTKPAPKPAPLRASNRWSSRASFRRWDGRIERTTAADAELMEDLGLGYC